MIIQDVEKNAKYFEKGILHFSEFKWNFFR